MSYLSSVRAREVKKGKSKEGTRNTNPPVFNLLFDFCFVPTVATPSQTQNVQILLEFRETILSRKVPHCLHVSNLETATTQPRPATRPRRTLQLQFCQPHQSSTSVNNRNRPPSHHHHAKTRPQTQQVATRFPVLGETFHQETFEHHSTLLAVHRP